MQRFAPAGVITLESTLSSRKPRVACRSDRRAAARWRVQHGRRGAHRRIGRAAPPNAVGAVSAATGPLPT
jgi:hypothetical protein